jgi:transketolase
VFAIVSDGDLMEGVASEAASLAGHLGLGRLIYLYDDNDISLDGPTSLSFETENVPQRFEAYGWHVNAVHDANDLTAIAAAIDEAQRHGDRPSLIPVKSIIGYPSPNKMGTSKAHGSALGEDEVRLTKEALGWDPDAHFLVPDGVYEAFDQKARGGEAHAAWSSRFEEWRTADADRAAEWDRAWAGEPEPGLAESLSSVDWGVEKLATRVAGQKSMAAFADEVPTMIGGAADLSESTKTEFPGGDAQHFTRERSGRNIFFGVREHGMGGTVNGIGAHGGIVRPYGSTFMQFTDYMRGSIRLSALSGLNVAWVYTHDSVALGEDGPTHQPVEHLAALRAIPELVVLRPGDANETAYAWLTILRDIQGPALMALSRQDLPVQAGASAEGVARGAYVIRPSSVSDERACVVGTGGELWVAIAAAEKLEAEGIGTRVVSMPSWELFRAQDDDYRESVLPVALASVSVEAGVSMGWGEWVDASVAIDRFGASAPGQEVLDKLGITPQAVVAKVKELLV